MSMLLKTGEIEIDNARDWQVFLPATARDAEKGPHGDAWEALRLEHVSWYLGMRCSQQPGEPEPGLQARTQRLIIRERRTCNRRSQSLDNPCRPN
jgi:hypothetical protein